MSGTGPRNFAQQVCKCNRNMQMHIKLHLDVYAPVVGLVQDFQLSARKKFQELLWLCGLKIVCGMLQNFRLILAKICAIPENRVDHAIELRK